MVFGYEFGSGHDKPIVHVDWSKIIEIDGKLATARLPERFAPTRIGKHETLFGLDFCYVNLPSINVPVSAEQLEAKWTEIEAQGMPLNLVSQCLAMLDILRLLASRQVSATPSWVSLPQLVFLASNIGESLKVSGFDVRLRDWSKRLRREARQAERKMAKAQPNEFIERVRQLEVSICSCLAEFRVMEHLLDHGSEIEVQAYGAEFVVRGSKPLKVEVKARLGHLPVDLWRAALEDKPTLESLVNPTGYLLALSLLLVDKFDEAFKEQGCDLLFEDISHTFLGWLLPVSATFWGKPLAFDDALADGLNAVSQGERAVIAYSYTAGPTGRIHAVSLTKGQVEEFAQTCRKVLRMIKDKPDARMLVDLLSRLMEPHDSSG